MGQRLRFGAKILRVPKDAEGRTILVLSSLGTYILTDQDFGMQHVDAILLASTTELTEFLEPEDMLVGIRDVGEVEFQ